MVGLEVVHAAIVALFEAHRSHIRRTRIEFVRSSDHVDSRFLCRCSARGSLPGNASRPPAPCPERATIRRVPSPNDQGPGERDHSNRTHELGEWATFPKFDHTNIHKYSGDPPNATTDRRRPKMAETSAL